MCKIDIENDQGHVPSDLAGEEIRDVIQVACIERLQQAVRTQSRHRVRTATRRLVRCFPDDRKYVAIYTMHAATVAGLTNEVKAAAEQLGGNVDAVAPKAQLTALALAVKAENLEMIKLLLHLDPNLHGAEHHVRRI